MPESRCENLTLGRSMLTIRKAIVVVGVTCLLLTGFGFADFSDDDDSNTPTLALTVKRNTITASTRSKMPSPTPISRHLTTEGVFDFWSRNCGSNLQLFCLLRC
jgi:hypothetical protein